MTKIRVLVVEDSATVRNYLVDVLQASSDLEVVAEADDGKQAIELCERLRPDVVTLDMMLPSLTGWPRPNTSWPIVPRRSSSSPVPLNRGEVFKTYEALAAGAVDVLEKPLGRHIRRPLGTPVYRNGQARLPRESHHPSARPAPVGNEGFRPARRLSAAGTEPSLPLRGDRRVDRRPAGPGNAPRPVAGRFPSPGVDRHAYQPRLWRGLCRMVERSIAGSRGRRGRRRGVASCAARRASCWLRPIATSSCAAGGFGSPAMPRSTRAGLPSTCCSNSVAQEVGDGAIAVLLTGMGRDGARGLVGRAQCRRGHARPGRGDVRGLRHAAGGDPHRRGKTSPGPGRSGSHVGLPRECFQTDERRA